MVFSHHLVLALISLSLANSGVMSALPLQWGLLGQFTAGSRVAAAIAMITSIGNLGGIAAPALLGWLKDKTQSLDVGVYVIASCVIISALLAFSFPREGRMTGDSLRRSHTG
jgi:nitrate/nitrite transporter NarK